MRHSLPRRPTGFYYRYPACPDYRQARSAIPVLALAMRKWTCGSLQYAGDAILESLVAIGGRDAALVLIQSLDDPSLAIRSTVCRALGRLPLEAKTIIPAVIDPLELEYVYSVSTLGDSGFGWICAAAHPAVPTIHRVRERFSADSNLADAAKLSISQIEAATK